MPRARDVVVMLATALAACTGKPLTPSECDALATKYFELWGREDPSVRALSQAEQAVKEREIATVDPDMRQVVECKDSITRSEYECALKARSKKAWNDCIY